MRIVKDSLLPAGVVQVWRHGGRVRPPPLRGGYTRHGETRPTAEAFTPLRHQDLRKVSLELEDQPATAVSSILTIIVTQCLFLIRIDALSYAEFAISEFEITRLDCTYFRFQPHVHAVDDGAGLLPH